MIQEKIIKATVEGIRALYNTDTQESTISIQKTRKEFSGDFTIVVFPFLKISKKSPEATAQDLGTYLANALAEISAYNVVKGFLNIELKDEFWFNFLNTESKNDQFGVPAGIKKQTFVVEYSSPNTNKPLHLGHIRNNLLGQSVADIVSFAGHKVLKVNLVNDRGIHICKSMLAYLLWGKANTALDKTLKGDHLAGKYYVKFEQEYRNEVAGLIAKGMVEEEAKNEAPLIKEARNMLLLWEKKDKDTLALWKKMNDMVLEGFEATYKKLGITFDKTYFESDTYLLGKEIVEEGLQKGIFFKKEDASVWVDLTADGLDEKLLLRADGTSVYMTQDLGTAYLRHEDFKADNYIYVVGNEQNYHFDVLKLILKKLAHPVGESLSHLSYGMVELPDGKMKSREGKVVDADDLIDEMFLTAKMHTETLGKTQDFASDEADELYRKLSLAALKYFILKVDPKKNMVFNPEESIDFNGNTGPFIQYAYVRIMSLSKKTQSIGIFEMNSSDVVALNSFEKSLLEKIHAFSDIIQEAANCLSPALIANYLYELAKEYNQFYHECPVLRESDTAKAALRLKISLFCAGILQKGMRLLGIEMPEKM
jgi:arginyl-tRNA synthetase